MEKFDIEEGKNLELFSNFANKTKDAFQTLIENIKENISKYEQSIVDTEEEIKDNQASCDKCEVEISKMEESIVSIEKNIENVENTYTKMVDAYASTGTDETKELYSGIIDDAKANCDKEVEKSKAEIEKLNSDIEAIKNNIVEFNKIIDNLKAELENQKMELVKFNKVLSYLEDVSESSGKELDKIEANIITSKEKKEKEPEVVEPIKEVITKEVEEVKEEVQEAPIQTLDFEDSLKQIYDLTGYKPKKEEEEAPKAKEVESNSLEDFFKRVDSIIPEETNKAYVENDMSEWEKILNGSDDSFVQVTPKEETIKIDSEYEVLDQLLKPYGTDYNRLQSLVQDKIVYKNGTTIPFEITVDDITKAINDVDGNDLKKMKIVGPEITLLRKIKGMKEGK